MSSGLDGAPTARAGRSAEQLAPQLLAFLREHENRSDLEFSSPPTLLAGGFDTTTVGFALADPPASLRSRLVLRLFRQDDPTLRPQIEAAFLNGLAEQDFPCPRALIVGTGGEIDGSNFIVMNRAPGAIMGISFGRLLKLPRVLADINLRLHEMNTEPILTRLGASGISDDGEWRGRDLIRMRESIQESGNNDFAPVVEWLEERWRVPEHPVVCHGDLHPFNLFEADGEISTVLDWGNARIEAAELDVATVTVIFRAGPIHIPRLLGPAFAAFVRFITWRYTRLYARGRELDHERFDYYRVLRSMQALVFREEAFSGARSQRELRAIVREVTGMRTR